MESHEQVSEQAVRNLAARLANTGQVLSAWANVLGGEGELAGRLERSVEGIEAAVGALTDDLPDDGLDTLPGVVHTRTGGVLGLRGRSEMIELVEFVGFVSGLGVDGVLDVTTARSRFVIELRQGYAVWVASVPEERDELLGDILLEQKAVRPREMELALAGARPGEFLGDTLSRFGLVDDAALRSALEERAVRIFCRMHGLGSGFDFEFQERARVASGEGIRVPISTLLLESARRVDEDQHGAERTAQERVLLERFRSGLESAIAHGELDLPVLPDATGQLLALCWADDCEPERVVACVSRDQALCAHLLRVANSAAYAPATPISSVQLAISRLGVEQLREIAMSLTLKQRVFCVEGWEDVVEQLWRTSAVTSGLAGSVGKHCGAGEGRGRMIGLLQDVGKPVVLAALYRIQEELGVELTPGVAEALMEEYHGPLGARLAETWQLPDWLSGAMRHHHDHDSADEHRLEATVGGFAAELATWLQDGGGDASELQELPTCADLRLSPTSMESILGEAESIQRNADAA